MKILLAVDGSAYTKKMLGYLVNHLEMMAGRNEFTALTVQPALPSRARAALGKGVLDTYYEEETAAILNPVVTFLKRHDLQVQPAWKLGPAGETIAQYAKDGKFDMIVMGSRGHGALGGLFMGSVATKVLANCEVPVLLVR